MELPDAKKTADLGSWMAWTVQNSIFYQKFLSIR
jgi:predicted small integral membrane protein